jgi:GTPase SAR1 family protein
MSEIDETGKVVEYLLKVLVALFHLRSTSLLLSQVLVVGDLGVGKTSLIQRYVHNIFSREYKATIGVDFAYKLIKISDDKVVRLQLWDIAGQERYGTMTRVCFEPLTVYFDGTVL